jgi:hypothetical protein
MAGACEAGLHSWSAAGLTAVSKSDQFRHYAEEAMLGIAQAKTEEERQLLLELLCTWTAAAVAADAVIPEARVPVMDFDYCH